MFSSCNLSFRCLLFSQHSDFNFLLFSMLTSKLPQAHLAFFGILFPFRFTECVTVECVAFRVFSVYVLIDWSHLESEIWLADCFAFSWFLAGPKAGIPGGQRRQQRVVGWSCQHCRRNRPCFVGVFMEIVIRGFRSTHRCGPSRTPTPLMLTLLCLMLLLLLCFQWFHSSLSDNVVTIFCQRWCQDWIYL